MKHYQNVVLGMQRDQISIKICTLFEQQVMDCQVETIGKDIWPIVTDLVTLYSWWDAQTFLAAHHTIVLCLLLKIYNWENSVLLAYEPRYSGKQWSCTCVKTTFINFLLSGNSGLLIGVMCR